jgi:hypothetical protein
MQYYFGIFLLVFMIPVVPLPVVVVAVPFRLAPLFAVPARFVPRAASLAANQAAHGEQEHRECGQKKEPSAFHGNSGRKGRHQAAG